MDSTLFFQACFVLYGLSLAAYLILIIKRHAKAARMALVIMVFAFTAHTFGIILRAIERAGFPITGVYDYLNVLGWFGVAFYIIKRQLRQNAFFGAGINLMVFMLLATASLLPKQQEVQVIPALQSIWLPLHVTMAVLAEGAFLIAFMASIVILVKSQRGPGTSLPNTGFSVPDDGTLAAVAGAAVKIGYLLFTVGALFAGSVWAYQAWGRFWGWDPKETCSLIVWCLYSLYLYARYVRGWGRKICAGLNVAGFIMTLFTIFSAYIFRGLHSYK